MKLTRKLRDKILGNVEAYLEAGGELVPGAWCRCAIGAAVSGAKYAAQGDPSSYNTAIEIFGMTRYEVDAFSAGFEGFFPSFHFSNATVSNAIVWHRLGLYIRWTYYDVEAKGK